MLLNRLFNRYTLVALWITPTGVTSQHIRFFSRTAALNTATSLRFHGEGSCTVCVIGPNGGLA